jgi:hypothetical protein
MKRSLLTACVALGVVAVVAQTSWGLERRNRVAANAYSGPWYGGYYDSAWGMPLSVLIPPTAEHQTHYNWGVGGTRITPNVPQFNRSWPGPSPYDARGILPTPAWPSSTDQFGDYYVRGPW